MVLRYGRVPQLRLAGSDWLEWDRTERMWGPWDAERVLDAMGWGERVIQHALKKRERQSGNSFGSRGGRTLNSLHGGRAA